MKPQTPETVRHAHFCDSSAVRLRDWSEQTDVAR